MENLSTFGFMLWPQVIKRLLFVWAPMNSCVKSLRLKSKDQGFNGLHMFSFILGIILFSIFVSFFKLNSKNQKSR